MDENKLSSSLRASSQKETEEGDTSKIFFIIFALCAEALFEGDQVAVSAICLVALEKLLKPWLVGETFFDKVPFLSFLHGLIYLLTKLFPVSPSFVVVVVVVSCHLGILCGIDVNFESHCPNG